MQEGNSAWNSKKKKKRKARVREFLKGHKNKKEGYSMIIRGGSEKIIQMKAIASEFGEGHEKSVK